MKAAFALGTFTPIVYGVVLLITGFSDSPLARAADAAYAPIVVVTIATWIAYIAHVLRNERLDRGRKALWVALLIFGTIFAEVAYFFFHVVNQPHTSRAERT